MRFSGPVSGLHDWLKAVQQASRHKRACVAQITQTHTATPHRPYGMPMDASTRRQIEQLTREAHELEACAPMIQQLIIERQEIYRAS